MKHLLFFYSVVLSLFTLLSYAFVDVNLVYMHAIFSNFAFEHRELTTILYITLLSLLFILYFLIIKWFQKTQQQMLWLKRYVFATTVILLFSYPAMLSYDIFNYMFTAKVLFYYQENPYIIMPIAFLGDPFLLFTHAANKTALYGPFWILLSGIPYLLGLGNFLLTLFNFKLFILAFYLATLWVLLKLTKNTQTLILFALNPLVIIETLVGAHNDIVMVFFILLAFWLLRQKHIFLTQLSFIVAVLIKYAVLVTAPIIAYLSWKTMKKEHIVWSKWYKFTAVVLLAFTVIAASIREEIYPWYAIWFLSFAFMVPEKKIFILLCQVISISLMLRYIPFMLLGTHFGPTPAIKILVTIIPVFIFLVYVAMKQSIWPKK